MNMEIAPDPKIHVSFTLSATKDKNLGHHISVREDADEREAERVFALAWRLHEMAVEKEAGAQADGE